jgi:hypothetical protein
MQRACGIKVKDGKRVECKNTPVKEAGIIDSN